MSKFERVGLVIPFGETAVQLGDVEPIREHSAKMLLLSGEIGSRALSRDGTVTFIQSFMGMNDFDSPSRYVAVRMNWKDDIDYWRLAINLSMYGVNFYSGADNRRYSSKRIRYIFEGLGDELLEAKKEVRLIDGRAAVSLKDGQPITNISERRKTYERLVKPEDCHNIVDLLRRTEARGKVA